MAAIVKNCFRIITIPRFRELGKLNTLKLLKVFDAPKNIVWQLKIFLLKVLSYNFRHMYTAVRCILVRNYDISLGLTYSVSPTFAMVADLKNIEKLPSVDLCSESVKYVHISTNNIDIYPLLIVITLNLYI